MFDDLLGGGGGGSRQLSSATATTSIADDFSGDGSQLTLSQIGPLLLVGLVTVAVLVIAMFALRD